MFQQKGTQRACRGNQQLTEGLFTAFQKGEIKLHALNRHKSVICFSLQFKVQAFGYKLRIQSLGQRRAEIHFITEAQQLMGFVTREITMSLIRTVQHFCECLLFAAVYCVFIYNFTLFCPFKLVFLSQLNAVKIHNLFTIQSKHFSKRDNNYQYSNRISVPYHYPYFQLQAQLTTLFLPVIYVLKQFK